MAQPDNVVSDPELIARMAKLWPHRAHEASILLGQLCRIGLHCWRRLDLSGLVPDREVRHCFWCSKIKLDGVIHEA